MWEQSPCHPGYLGAEAGSISPGVRWLRWAPASECLQFRSGEGCGAPPNGSEAWKEGGKTVLELMEGAGPGLAGAGGCLFSFKSQAR